MERKKGEWRNLHEKGWERSEEKIKLKGQEDKRKGGDQRGQ